MPEGDSIRRDAVKLANLVGQTLARVTTQGLERDLEGRTVATVTPYGKHLTIGLDNGTELRVHRGIRGGFRAMTRTEGDAQVARMSPGRASLVVATTTDLYLWRDARTVEIAPRRAIQRGVAVAALGADIMADGFDPAAAVAVARATSSPARSICDVLLDQRIAAGIGNIFKNEALAACNVAPRARLGELTDPQLVALYIDAHTRMRLPRGPHQVYGRTHQTCRTCSTPLQIASLGETPRWTWWCPQCQAVGSAAGVSK